MIMCVSRVAWEAPTHSWYLLNRTLIVVIYMSIDFAVDESGDSGRYSGCTAPGTGMPAVNQLPKPSVESMAPASEPATADVGGPLSLCPSTSSL